MRQLEHFNNLVTMFFTRAREKGDAPFLWAKRNGTWQATTWATAAASVAAIASSLKALGLQPGDRVMIVSENRPEWLIADLAIMAAGCVSVPTYITNTTRDHQHIIDDSGARAIFVSSEKLAKTLLPAAVRSGCEHIIGMEPIRNQASNLRFHDWDALVAAGSADVAACAKAAEALTRDDLACIIYTSGTGGAPRGVMQHHGAILHNCEGAAEIISEDFGWDDEVFLSFLPASHAYEHSGGQMFPMGLGGQIYYAESLEKLAANIEEVRPTIMMVLPRLFEVLRARILKTIEKQGKATQYLLKRAMEIGAKDYAGKVPLKDRPMDFILDRTFRPKIFAKFGGRMKAMISGGAPLNPDVGIFFHSIGLTLLQGYGQTEAGPVISANRPKVGLKMDTVGPPVRNTDVRIAEDGEILVRGELVMKGYWRNEAHTASTIVDGWLHTGDVGHFDDKGRIVITDRKKDIIVLDKGDNVAPQRVEGMLTLQPEIAQAMVVGDRRPYLVGLVMPDAEWMAEWAKANGKPNDLATLRTDPDFVKAVGAAVNRVSAELSVIEKVRSFIIADEPFTTANEQMTTTLKIRRHVLKDIYGPRLDALYKR
ncbi:long-chain fatty acid--CoA ligase [Allosphingosinicella flava]|uniref:Long-chain fatty acid--CoA ligase n=1 Tax=Allosphingosinicella flava TaxID=2771430 RepID=A0A7T2LLR4_9SPHN|nr:AMP-dependent synthetase/ligase [Sphingosinicella flava]QPQ54653.1 long-chain fatty acid--CoA ligase [Sphingosinicella flava]